MKRLFVLILSVVALPGCCDRQTASGVDPFFGYTRIPPPGTGAISGQAADPYYMGAPAATNSTGNATMANPGASPTFVPGPIAPGSITSGSATPLQPGSQYPSGVTAQPSYGTGTGTGSPSPSAGTPPSYGTSTQPSYGAAVPPSYGPGTQVPAGTNQQSPSGTGSPLPAVNEGNRYTPPGGTFDYRGGFIPGGASSGSISSGTRVASPSFAQRVGSAGASSSTATVSPSISNPTDNSAAQLARREPVVQVLQPRPATSSRPSPAETQPASVPSPAGEPRRLQSPPRAVDIMELPKPGTSAAATRVSSGSGSSTVRLASGTKDDDPSRATAAVAEAPVDTGGAEFAPAGRYGHDSQYRWLRGKLEHSQIEGCWKLRYIPVDGTTDEFGGSVILADASVLAGCERGEFVEVRGKLSSGRPKEGFAPTYEAAELKRINP